MTVTISPETGWRNSSSVEWSACRGRISFSRYLYENLIRSLQPYIWLCYTILINTRCQYIDILTQKCGKLRAGWYIAVMGFTICLCIGFKHDRHTTSEIKAKLENISRKPLCFQKVISVVRLNTVEQIALRWER